MTNVRLQFLFSKIRPAFPDLSEQEQHVGLRLYQLLLAGEPVPTEEIVTSVGKSSIDPHRALEGGLRNLVLYDEQQRLIGFAGLAVTPTAHGLLVNGKQLFTWCAWDTLFIPELIGAECAVRSQCAETHVEINVVVTPRRVESVDPAETVVSFVVPDTDFCHCSTHQRIAGFCNHVHFLANEQAGEAWSRQRDGVILLSLDDAFTLGKMLNATRYPAALAVWNRMSS